MAGCRSRWVGLAGVTVTRLGVPDDGHGSAGHGAAPVDQAV
jgi:hypothetical protein